MTLKMGRVFYFTCSSMCHVHGLRYFRVCVFLFCYSGSEMHCHNDKLKMYSYAYINWGRRVGILFGFRSRYEYFCFVWWLHSSLPFHLILFESNKILDTIHNIHYRTVITKLSFRYTQTQYVTQKEDGDLRIFLN